MPGGSYVRSGCMSAFSLGASDFGAWEPWQEERSDGDIATGVLLRTAGAPWRRLFECLDVMGQALSDAPVNPLDEADAIVACCWRYGSYAHILAQGKRHPLAGHTAGIRDAEMMRVNIEFSAGLAAWLETRSTHPDIIRRRTRSALQHLDPIWRRH